MNSLSQTQFGMNVLRTQKGAFLATADLHEKPITMVPKETWEQEYSVFHAIPSSLRTEPAKALVLFADLLNLRNKRVMDAGCGNGRNAVYLAKRGCEVTAIDFAEVALTETQRRATAAGVQHRVSVEKVDLSAVVPYISNSFDFVLDAYTFCHFLDEVLATGFWTEMKRVVRLDGYLMSVAFSTDDSYYTQFRSRDGNRIVFDPTNRISKRLYEETELKAFFYRLFRIEYFARFEFEDLVHGRSFKRVVFTSILRHER
jgi:cyclopropane fatty-acyl-phospholipid synthase-like methyltransferase